MSDVVLKTDLPLKLHSRGKVRDTYEFGDKLLMVTTDRLSAFDVVFPNGIPWKGTVLNELSLFWFDYTKKIVKNHVLSSDVPGELAGFKDILARRSVIVTKTVPVRLECVVRGYLSGSAWKDYTSSGQVCGIRLPSGLIESDRLSEPIFTPTTKAETGHDLGLDEQAAVKLVGRDVFEKVRELTLSIYSAASKHAESCGLILADTKMEFGMLDDEIILIDELLTPDSSRFWPADAYSPGRAQQSFDKQFVRDYLERLGWGKKPPAPILPDDVVRVTSEKYIDAFERLTGKPFLR